MDMGETASAAAPGALGVLNPCVRGPRYLHAWHSTALACSAEMEDWWLGQAAVGVVAAAAAAAVVVVTVVEAEAALGEGQSAQSCSLSCACLQG